MKQNFFEIKHLEDYGFKIQFIPREGSASFFSFHPMRKLGKDIKYTADLFYCSHYHSKSSCASKGTSIITIYTYGEEQTLSVKGWIFPYKFKFIDYTSASGDIWYTMISFTCKKPDGQDMYVFYRTRGDECEILAEIFKKLLEMEDKTRNSLDFDIYRGFSRY